MVKVRQKVVQNKMVMQGRPNTPRRQAQLETLATSSASSSHLLQADFIERCSMEWFEALMKCKEDTALGIPIVATLNKNTRHAEPEAMAM
jgi:hypothetical protein